MTELLERERLTDELDTAKKYAEAYFDESELLKKQVAKLRAALEQLSSAVFEIGLTEVTTEPWRKARAVLAKIGAKAVNPHRTYWFKGVLDNWRFTYLEGTDFPEGSGIKDFAIWRDALTQEELDRLAEGQRPPQVNKSKLQEWWPLDGLSD